MKIYWVDKWDLKDYYKEKSELKPIQMVGVEDLIRELEIIADGFIDETKSDVRELLNSLSNEKAVKGK